jgi:hypothetical protein
MTELKVIVSELQDSVIRGETIIIFKNVIPVIGSIDNKLMFRSLPDNNGIIYEIEKRSQ